MKEDDPYLAARARTINKMQGMCEWLSLVELAGHIAESGAAERVTQWERERRIFGVPSDTGPRYGRFQFDDAMRPLPVIQEILTLLGKDDAWAIAAWFLFKNGWLSACVDGEVVAIAPIHALQQHDAVLMAARNATGTYIA